MDKSVLGKMVEDKITGFKGIATAVTHWLNGCTRISVQPRELFEGKAVKEDWFDDTQLILLSDGLHEDTTEKQEKAIGGPQRDPGGWT